MNITFENKRVLVTGGCQGIGKEICLHLLKYKATVVALSNNKRNLDQLAKEHPNVETVCVDLLDWNATREAVKRVLPIDLLVNNAGVGTSASCLTSTAQDFDLVFGVNVKAMLNVSQIVSQNMIDRKINSGSIVNLSSQTGVDALKGVIIYGSSKSAVNMLTKGMALELGPHNIRVNCVQPTLVMNESGRNYCKDVGKAEALRSRIPLGRFAEVAEVANAVIFLLSDYSSMINGVGLPIDGGYLAA